MVRRLLLSIPTMLLVFTVVFVILRVIPGDPAIAMLSGGAQTETAFTQEDVDRLKAKLGTDRPSSVDCDGRARKSKQGADRDVGSTGYK